MFVFGTWDKHGPPQKKAAVTLQPWDGMGETREPPLQKDTEESAHTFSSIRNSKKNIFIYHDTYTVYIYIYILYA